VEVLQSTTILSLNYKGDNMKKLLIRCSRASGAVAAATAIKSNGGTVTPILDKDHSWGTSVTQDWYHYFFTEGYLSKEEMINALEALIFYEVAFGNEGAYTWHFDVVKVP
jgi:hypothetical protein